MEDTEMVSEDELPVESKEPLDTEAVSDEELPDSSVKEPVDLPETEAVSEDELPVEGDKKRRKKASQAQAGMLQIIYYSGIGTFLDFLFLNFDFRNRSCFRR